MTLLQEQQTGQGFSKTVYFEARRLCHLATKETISCVEVGMSARDINQILLKVFLSHGFQKFWHAPKIRLGADTIKNFELPNDDALRCVQGDLCSIDVGPVYQGHEADYGDTFVVGGQANAPLIRACHDVFNETANHWRSQGVTGLDLLKFASAAASKCGFKLNAAMSGHRLGDYPHKLFSQTALFEFAAKPLEDVWVLEIHVIDDKVNRGAFFEDILSV